MKMKEKSIVKSRNAYVLLVDASMLHFHVTMLDISQFFLRISFSLIFSQSTEYGLFWKALQVSSRMYNTSFFYFIRNRVLLLMKAKIVHFMDENVQHS